MPDSNNPNATNSTVGGGVAAVPGGAGLNPTPQTGQAQSWFTGDPSSQIASGREGIADGSWVPFQNYSQIGGSGLFKLSGEQEQAANGSIMGEVGGGTNSSSSSPVFPLFGTQAPAVSGINGDGVTLGPWTPPAGNTGSSPPPSNPANPPAGTNPFGNTGTGFLTAASPLAPGPGPGGFYGTALSRYLTGK